MTLQRLRPAVRLGRGGTRLWTFDSGKPPAPAGPLLPPNGDPLDRRTDRLRILAILAAVFAAIAFAVGERAGLPGTIGLAITGLVLAGAMWQARRISSFLRVFLTVFVLEYAAFGAMVLVSGLGWWP